MIDHLLSFRAPSHPANDRASLARMMFITISSNVLPLPQQEGYYYMM